MRLGIVACGCVLGLSAQVWGAFVNGRENFSGTTLDTSTWLATTSTSGPFFSQNGALTLHSYDSPNGIAAYTTLAPLVGVGQTARVEARIDRAAVALPVNVALLFMLTSDPDGLGPGGNDSYYLSIRTLLSNDPNSLVMEASAGRPNSSTSGINVGGSYNTAIAPLVGDTYSYQIDRLTATQVHFAVYHQVQPAGGGATHLETFWEGTRDFTSFGGFSAPMRVQFLATGMDVTFDNVMAAPDPSMIGFLPLLGLLARRRSAQSPQDQPNSNH